MIAPLRDDPPARGTGLTGNQRQTRVKVDVLNDKVGANAREDGLDPTLFDGELVLGGPVERLGWYQAACEAGKLRQRVGDLAGSPPRSGRGV
jgi:hypothetical protein